MQPSRSYNFGRIREAGSLETSSSASRRINVKSALPDVETSHQYDDLFLERSQESLQTSKKPTAPINTQGQKATNSKSFFNFDLDRIDVDNDDDDDDEDLSDEQRNESPKPKERNKAPQKAPPQPKKIEKSQENSTFSNTNTQKPLDEKFSDNNNPFLARSLSLQASKETKVSRASNLKNSDSETDEQDDVRIRPVSNGVASKEIPRNDFKNPYFENPNQLEFLFRLAPYETLIRCQIFVQQNTLSSNDFDLYLEDSSRDVSLLSTQPKRAMTGVNLGINTNLYDPAVRKYRQKRLGKLRSDLSRNYFQLNEVLNDQRSSQYFQLFFKKQSMTNPMPKEIELFLRSMPVPVTANDEEEAMANSVYKLMSKQAEFDKIHRTYRLDFKGRAKKASSNNVQIVDAESLDRVLWQIGKIKKNHYILDFSYPFSVFTAFGTALACLLKK